MLRSFAFFILLSFIPNIYAEQTPEEVFTNIYSNKVWGQNENGEGHSGGGSTLQATIVYRTFLQDFLSQYNIHSVLDVGCGDWEFSQAIDWTGIKYIGYDVVDEVIENNRAKFGTDNILFFTGNILNSQLQKADLLICKEVLQHLTNRDILKFIYHISKFKYCLITNDVDPISLTSTNPDIERGDCRYLDLTKPPFNLNGIKILTYEAGGAIKSVLLIQNRK